MSEPTMEDVRRAFRAGWNRGRVDLLNNAETAALRETQLADFLHESRPQGEGDADELADAIDDAQLKAGHAFDRYLIARIIRQHRDARGVQQDAIVGQRIEGQWHNGSEFVQSPPCPLCVPATLIIHRADPG